MAYIWNTHGKTPGEIYNLPPLEKEFIYQATRLKIEAEEKEAKKAKRKGGKR